jgi:hypothetical protein
MVNSSQMYLDNIPGQGTHLVLLVADGICQIWGYLDLRIRRLGVRIPPSASEKSRSKACQGWLRTQQSQHCLSERLGGTAKAHVRGLI